MNIAKKHGSGRPPFEASIPGILDSLLEGCQVIGFDWRYLYLNEVAASHGRRPREELLGRTMMEAYPGIEDTEMFSILQQCMEERAPRRMENEFAFPDGSTGWFELRFEPVPEGVFILSLDITGRKRAEESMAHLNAVLRGIRKVNQLITREQDRDRLIRQACELLVEARGFYSVAVGLTDESGKKVLAHAEAGRTLASLQEMFRRGEIPACARQAMADRKIVLWTNQKEFCKGCPVAAEVDDGIDDLTIALEQDGRLYGFMSTCLPAGTGESPEEQDLLLEAAGDIAFALHSMEIRAERDKSATALAKTEEHLRQVQKLEAIGQLAGGVAHDFNNILAAQVGYCEIMKNNLRQEDPLAEDLARIEECADRAAALTRQLLAFSRKQTLQVEVLDLNAVVANIEKMLGRLIGEDIDIAMSLDGDLDRIKADPGQIEQVVMNLAVNARDAMPQGGKLTIETANVELDEKYAQNYVSVTAGPHIMLAVTDNGCGMDEETKRRIFEPFFTTKGLGKGTGLGLATVYGIVKQSGGSIWVYSEPGEGTTFKIYLPRVEAELTQHAKRQAGVSRGNGELVLMVEDEPFLRDIFARLIKDLGYRVRAAANGDEALAMVERDNLGPDILITDLVMPGMSGKTLADRLHRMQPGLKVLYTSGYTDDAIVHHGVLDAETPFLQKPFGSAVLAAKIREVLASN